MNALAGLQLQNHQQQQIAQPPQAPGGFQQQQLQQYVPHQQGQNGGDHGGLRGQGLPPQLESKFNQPQNILTKKQKKDQRPSNHINSYDQQPQQSYQGGACSISHPRLYVGKYGKGATKRDILPLFEKYGQIVDHLIKDDFSFIEFTNIYDAERALKDLDGTRVKGQKILVQESKPKGSSDKNNNNKNNFSRPPPRKQSGGGGGGFGKQLKRLYVGKINGATEYDLRNLFQVCGNIVDVMVAKDGDYAFVEFSYEDEADEAIRRYDRYSFRGGKISVEHSNPRDKDSKGGNDRGRGGGGAGAGSGVNANRGGPIRGGNQKFTSSSIFAKVRGLPYNSKIDETLKIIDKYVEKVLKQDVVYEFDICGKFTGSIYVNLQKHPEDFKYLKNMENEQMGKRYIEVIPVDEHDYQYGIDNNIPYDPRLNPVSESENSKGHIRIRGLPFKCTTEQIQLLLEGFQIVTIKLLNKSNSPAGECLVTFTSKEAAIHSLHWQNQQVEGRYVEIALSNEKEFQNFEQNDFDIDKIKAQTSREEERLQRERQERIRQKQQQSYRREERSRSRNQPPRGGHGQVFRGGDRKDNYSNRGGYRGNDRGRSRDRRDYDRDRYNGPPQYQQPPNNQYIHGPPQGMAYGNYPPPQQNPYNMPPQSFQPRGPPQFNQGPPPPPFQQGPPPQFQQGPPPNNYNQGPPQNYYQANGTIPPGGNQRSRIPQPPMQVPLPGIQQGPPPQFQKPPYY